MIAGRALGPSDYGLVAALLSVVVLASVPCGALQSGIGQAIASRGQGTGWTLYRRLGRVSWRAAAAATAVVTIGLLVVEAMQGDIPLVAMLLTVGSLACLPTLFLGLGALQGAQSFRDFAAGFAMWGAPRPLLLLPAIALGIGVAGPLGATLVSIGGAAAFCAWRARSTLGTSNEMVSHQDWKELLGAIRPLAAGLFGVALLTNLDVMVAKASLGDAEAGRFAAIAVLSKAILIVPQSIGFVLLPRVARRRAERRSTVSMLALAVVGTLGAAAAAAALCVPAADALVELTFGREYAQSADQLPAFILSSGVIGAVLVAMNHQAGRGDTRFGWWLALVGVGQLSLFLLVNDSGGQIILVNALAGAVALVVHELVHRREGDRVIDGVRSLLRARRSDAPTGD